MNKILLTVMIKVAVCSVVFGMLFYPLLALSSTTTQQLQFTGAGTNLTFNVEFTIEISMTINEDNSVSGSLDATGLPGGSIICGAGNFTGTKTGDNIEFTFTSNDSDPGCGFDHGVINYFHTRLLEGGTVLSGNYDLSNGQRGIVRLTTNSWGSLDHFRNVYNSRKGTNGAGYAHQFFCIAETSCTDYEQNGASGWASGFVQYLFEYQATHNEGERGLDVVCPTIYADWQCFKAASGIHGINELQPAFFSYCNQYTGTSKAEYDAWETKWTTDHENFLDNAFDSCFDTVIQDGELPMSLGRELQGAYKEIARKLRTSAQVWCRAKTGNVSNLEASDSRTLLDNFPTFPPPLTQGDLYFEEIAANTALTVTAGEQFFLPVGTSVQLSVTKQNPDGSITDLTFATGTRYSMDLDIGKEVATVTNRGLLSVAQASSPITPVQQILHVVVQNGDDLGIGQFAIVDSDTDKDLIVDSYETRIGLNPNRANSIVSDIDRDLTTDLYEAMIGTKPTEADSDGDKFRDGFEEFTGSDPLDPACTPVFGCVSSIYLPLVRR